jgi:glycosyltransferase involved in cell wall biosynthesis
MITIAIPVRNEARHIGRLLDSIVAQDITEEVDVVIADADSTDNTRDVVMGYRTRLPRVRIVEGGPPSLGRNRAAHASKGDPIFFVDADIVFVRPSFLRTAVGYFREHKLAIAATPLVPRSKKMVDRFWARALNASFHVMKYIQPVGTMCIVSSRDAFDKSGGFPENAYMGEDYDFVRACARLGPYGIVPEPVLFSVRRLEKEGRLGATWKYTKVVAYRMFVGPVPKDVVPYDFNYSEKEDSV